MITIKTQPFTDQKPGTSGLRKSTRQFQQPHYLENFVQSTFNALGDNTGKTLVLGGDGRYFNREAIQIILKMAAANTFTHIMVGKAGLLSTPAASLIIRKYQADGGIILSASHNPGGEDGDFGIKYNINNGGPAPEIVTDKIYQHSLEILEYHTTETADISLDQTAEHFIGKMKITVIDSVTDYADLMQDIYDFDLMRQHIKTKNLNVCFDAMHAITGPYATEIFCKRLGINNENLINAIPSPNFGGGHPDPNQAHASQLLEIMNADDAPTLGAASDGDGDRNMIVGKHFFVTPSDSLAIIAANAHLIKFYQAGLSGVARSMPTSRAIDAVAEKLNIKCYETPTGWKFFGNLLDADKITLCGEESFGTGSLHIREKDGLWAVLFWLNLLAIKQQSVETIVTEHWKQFGRHYYMRHDYEAIELEAANNLIETLRNSLSQIDVSSLNQYSIKKAYDFSYQDSIDNTVTEKQGLVIELSPDARIIYRLSGTGTQGATLRVYLEKFEKNTAKQADDSKKVLAELATLSQTIAQIEKFTGRQQPSVIT